MVQLDIRFILRKIILLALLTSLVMVSMVVVVVRVVWNVVRQRVPYRKLTWSLIRTSKTRTTTTNSSGSIIALIICRYFSSSN